jgi:hypothetical protein
MPNAVGECNACEGLKIIENGFDSARRPAIRGKIRHSRADGAEDPPSQGRFEASRSIGRIPVSSPLGRPVTAGLGEPD